MVIYLAESENTIRSDIQNTLLHAFPTTIKIEFVGTAHTRSKILNEIKKLNPDICILSCPIKGGTTQEIIYQLTKEKSEMLILILSDKDFFSSKTNVFVLYKPINYKRLIYYIKNFVYPDRMNYIEPLNQLYDAIQYAPSEVKKKFFAVIRHLDTLEKEERENILIEILVVASFLIYQKEEKKKAILVDCLCLLQKRKESWNTLVQYVYRELQIMLMKKENSPVHKIIESAKDYMEKNYQSVTISNVAKHVGVTVNYLCAIFKSETNMSCLQWLTQFKIQEAKKLLWKTDLTIEEIARQLGYKDPSYFSRLFKKEAGIIATKFREIEKKKSNMEEMK